jgi:thiol:disulfide interchange protein DsbD
MAMMPTHRFTCLLAAVFLVIFAATPSRGETPEATHPIAHIRAYVSHASIRPGEAFKLALVTTIRPGFHINSHEPEDEFLVPTVAEFDAAEGIGWEPVFYPIPVWESLTFSEKRVSVYQGTVSMIVVGKVNEDLPPGQISLSGRLRYQPCDDKACYMPETVEFSTALRVVSAAEPSETIHHEIFQGRPELTADEIRVKEVIEKGLLYAMGMFLVFGLALNLTPCVYPVIPMTVGFFGSQGRQKKRRTFLLASYYVVGIAVVFSALGLLSGLAGKQWGFLFQSPWFVIAVSVVILSMAASMFGAFEITVPQFLMRLGGKSRQGGIGAFVMGLTVGVVIAPCAAGVVIGLVGIIAKLGMVFLGAVLFFVMGLGLGMPYLFLAVSSGLMSHLPKSGMWMVWIRKVFGILLIGVAVYFLVPQAQQAPDQMLFYLGVLGVFGGILLGFLDRAEGFGGRSFKIIRTVVGCVMIVGGILCVNRGLHPAPKGVAWVHTDTQARAEGKPLLLDFYAQWCGVCKQLDRETFSDKRVVEMAEHFVMAKIDLTTPTAASSALREKFRIAAMPTIVFVGPDGVERTDLRIVGFAGPDQMIERMKSALGEKQ